jgi:pyrimidine operon attenuation protein/uracil phosphoribosyltransferase
MQKRLIIDHHQLDLTLRRLCQELIENHPTFEETVCLGLQPRGTLLAARLVKRLETLTGVKIPLGYLDTTFYRDDFRRKAGPIKANSTQVPFLVEGKKVILVDDVLYTGRSVRAALDAMIAFGRPEKVELLVLIDRKYTRELPVEANYIGRKVNTLPTERVLVEWAEDEKHENNIWIISNPDD